MILAFGSSGPHVVRLQTTLAALASPGSPGPGKPDGDFGPKTAAAVKAYQAARGAAETGTVDLFWLEAYEAAALAAAKPPAPAPTADPTPDHEIFRASFVDLREHHSPLVRSTTTKKMVPYEPAARKWSEVRGACVHQTACQMGERDARYYTCGAHFAIPRSGRILWLADLDRVVYAANGFNAQTVSIEIDGLYAGLEDDPDTAQDEALRTTWDDPDTSTRETPQTPTPAALRSARLLIRWLREETRLRGGVNFSKVLVHRQSSGDRQNDPGQEIHRGVVLPLLTEGFSDGGPGFFVGSGRPIPEQWDPSRVGVPY